MLLENVECPTFVIKGIVGLTNKSYEKFMSLSQLTTLETRRTRGDVIQAFI